MTRPTERQITSALQNTLLDFSPKGLDHNPKIEVHVQDLKILRDFALARGDNKPQETLLGFIDLLDRDAITFAGQDRVSVRFSRDVWNKVGQPQSLFFDIRLTPQEEQKRG